MNFRRIATLYLFAAVLVMACEKEGNKKNSPSSLPDEKVSKVYEASTVKTEMKIGEEWKTIANKTNARTLAHEFTWEGDRLESVMDHNLGYFYSFGYDENGRISHIYSDGGNDFSRSLSYNEDGLLSRSEGTQKLGDGTLIASQNFVYTWVDGLLKTIEEDYWRHDPGEDEITRKSTYTFTWKDGNVISSSCHTEKNGTAIDDAQYTFEYSSAVNPLRGFVFCQLPGYGIVFDYNGIDGLSRNLPSRVVSTQGNRYEYSYSGERMATVEKHLIADSSPTLHFYTDYTLDFEYMQ